MSMKYVQYITMTVIFIVIPIRIHIMALTKSMFSLALHGSLYRYSPFKAIRKYLKMFTSRNSTSFIDSNPLFMFSYFWECASFGGGNATAASDRGSF